MRRRPPKLAISVGGGVHGRAVAVRSSLLRCYKGKSREREKRMGLDERRRRRRRCRRGRNEEFLAEEEGILIGSSMHITTVRFIAFVVKS
jgi:hypothetical protein